jgi:polar amino acid transport system substrate-binding protein
MLGDPADVKFTPVDAASRVQYLQSGKVDIILANFTKTPERAEMVDFALPYMKTALGVVSPASALITSIDQLKDKMLIVHKGTTAEMYFVKNYPDIKLIKFDQKTETFNALKDGRGAALSHDNTLCFAWVKDNPSFTVGIQTLGDIDTINPAVKKGNKALLDWLNDEIRNKLPPDFFHKDYAETLGKFYGPDIEPESVVVENGSVN